MERSKRMRGGVGSKRERKGGECEGRRRDIFTRVRGGGETFFTKTPAHTHTILELFGYTRSHQGDIV